MTLFLASVFVISSFKTLGYALILRAIPQNEIGCLFYFCAFGRAGMSAVRKKLFGIVLVAASLFFMNGYFTQAADPKDKDVILSTTTSTEDSGLLNELIPLFETQSGYR